MPQTIMLKVVDSYKASVSLVTIPSLVAVRQTVRTFAGIPKYSMSLLMGSWSSAHCLITFYHQRQLTTVVWVNAAIH